jgi:acid phosphatase (class A)
VTRVIPLKKPRIIIKRQRPFVVNKEPSCSPDDENALAKNGSHPSGHAAICLAWALILSEIAPEQMDGILARGWAFGESRLVCNVHWQSDVAEGRVVGASAVAQLHADFTFREDLEAAKAELRTVRARGLNPLHDCTAEAAALAK